MSDEAAVTAETATEQTPADKGKGVLAKLKAQTWAMQPRALESLFELLASSPTAAKDRSQKQSSPSLRVLDGIAHIAVKGVLLKEVPWIFEWYGIEATAYGDIERQISEATADDTVSAIQMDIDSPGGIVDGVFETADSIFTASRQKTTIAVIDGIGASAAYWLASQAGQVIAGRTAETGSIGVYAVIVDSSKRAEDLGFKVHVVKSAPHKGTGVPGAPISDAQIEPIQAVVDGLADIFVKSVAAGRDKPVKDVRGWATGESFLADKALSMGLIDDIFKNKSQVTKKLKGQIMPKDKETEAADAQVDVQKLTDQVQGQERGRLRELRSYFSTDLEFAMTAFEKGWTLQEAKAGYCDVQQERLSAAANEIVELKAAAEAAATKAAEANTRVKPKGTLAISTGSSDAAAGGLPDLLSTARQRAKEQGITVTAAIRQLYHENPELYQAQRRREA